MKAAPSNRNPLAIALSVLVHIVVIGLVVVSFQWTPSISTPASQPIIQAVAVDEQKIEQEARKIEKAEAERKATEDRRKREAEQAAKKLRDQRVAEEKRLADLQKKRVEEEQQRKEIERQRKVAEQKHQEAERQRQEAEAKRVAAQKAEQERLEKLRKEREVEEQRLAALEAKRKMEEEKRRKEEAERQRREEEEHIRQEQIAAENARLEQERQLLANQTIAKYTDLMRQKVSRNWLRPAGSRNDLKCTVRVRLIPSGDVVGVQIITTSGDPVFDRSVETAVRRASPLPIPSDALVFDRMREIDFVFDPAKG